MKKVYSLFLCTTFERDYIDNYSNGFYIGLFESFEQAQAVEARYRAEVPGFKDYDCDAYIIEIPVVNCDHQPDKVYRFTGWNTDKYYDKVDVIESNCYATQADAIDAMSKAEKELPREKWKLNSFTIGKFAWSEGFKRFDSLITRNHCYTYFKITGTFNPDDATKLLGLQPEKTWKIGDKRPNGTILDFAMWSFGSCEDYNPYVEEQMRKTIAPLVDKVELLKRFHEQNDVIYTLEVVPTIYIGDTNPCLAPPLDVIDFCHATRTAIDIDLSIYEKGSI